MPAGLSWRAFLLFSNYLRRFRSGLLILDVDRFWVQLEHFRRGQQWISLFGVIVVEKFEPGVLDRLGNYVVPV